MIKRIFDFTLAIVGLFILCPVMLAIGIMIKLKMPGKVLFKQIRTGRKGRNFTIYKFRTMDSGHRGNTISVKGEARITPLGAILRRYKLDELPELWNVIKGDMSFVGPRPDVPEFAEKLKGDDLKILELRPGLTGPATLKYANEEELLSTVPDPEKYNNEIIWPDKVRLNLEYYHNSNILRDIAIIFKTIFR